MIRCYRAFGRACSLVARPAAKSVEAIEVASDFVGESIPVIDRSEGTMVGVVTEADLFKLYLSLQHRVADLERT